jgi:hypothetical protein
LASWKKRSPAFVPTMNGRSGNAALFADGEGLAAGVVVGVGEAVAEELADGASATCDPHADARIATAQSSATGLNRPPRA